MSTNIETKTAATVLQKPLELTLGGVAYKVAQPSIATLIRVSEAITHLPRVTFNEKKVVEESLSVAKDCRVLGDVAAILILGAKACDEPVKVPLHRRRRFWRRFFGRGRCVTMTRQEALARTLLEDATPQELQSAVASTVMTMQIGDFFGLTTFLTEINLIRPTKVETEATASGR